MGFCKRLAVKTKKNRLVTSLSPFILCCPDLPVFPNPRVNEQVSRKKKNRLHGYCWLLNPQNKVHLPSKPKVCCHVPVLYHPSKVCWRLRSTAGKFYSDVKKKHHADITNNAKDDINSFKLLTKFCFYAVRGHFPRKNYTNKEKLESENKIKED